MKLNYKAALRFLASLLAVGTIAMSFAACASDSTSTDDTTSQGTTAAQDVETTEAVETTTALTNGLPEVDLNGIDFNILQRSEFVYEFGAESTGEVVNDAVYDRNLAVSERFNAKLNVLDVKGSWSEMETFKKALNDSILAADGSYDLVAGASNYVMAMTSEGGFVDLMTVDHLDFSKPWWSQGFVDNMQVKGALYMASGDVALTSVENMCVVLFNKQLVSDYKLDMPYDAVLDGSWTLDKMMASAKQVSEDINGDGVFDANDRYGFMTVNNMVRAMIQSFEIPYTSLDDEGYPQIDFMSDRLVTAFDKVSAAMKEQSSLNYTSDMVETLSLADAMQKIFSNAQVLFMSQVLSSAEQLRSMEVDFGILPYPKLDESQERYYTTVLENLTAMGIITSAKDYDNSGLILEALAFEGYDKITPAYIDTALKGKYTRDVESEAMVDIALDGRWFDFGYINSSFLEGINAIFADCVLNDKPITSEFEANKEKFETNMAKLIDFYKGK